jgi:hypothetical protein
MRVRHAVILVVGFLLALSPSASESKRSVKDDENAAMDTRKKGGFGGGFFGGGKSSSVGKTSTGTGVKTSTGATSKTTSFSTKVNKSTQKSPRSPSSSSTFRGGPLRYNAGATRSIAGFRGYYFIGAWFLLSGSSRRYRCGENEFRYGSHCRKCSTIECPVGQYRVECSMHNDGYCKPCTNKPSGEGELSAETHEYTEPGNNNNCAYEACPMDQCPDDFADDESAVSIQFNMDVPAEENEWGGFEDRYRENLQGLVAPGGSSVALGATAVSIDSIAGVTAPAEMEERRALPQGAHRQADAVRATNESCEAVTSNSTTGAVKVSVTVQTTMDKIDATWAKLNEYAINEALAAACLPPAVVYYDTSAGERALPHLWLALAGLLLVLLQSMRE